MNGRGTVMLKKGGKFKIDSCRDIYGPGKYIFGVFDNRELDHTYMVKYNDDED